MEARKEKEPDYTWEVRANDSSFHKSANKFLFFQKRKYVGNSITTSKYNVLTFIPLNIFHQLHQGYVIYFVIMVILQCIPQITTSPWYANAIPLSILMTLKAIKALIEDIARHKSDRKINNRPSEILQESSFCRKKWKDVNVGDIVRLKKDDLVPADMLLLQSSEPNSLCYVETSGIDGETNLKFRQAPLITHTGLRSTLALAKFNGKVICEAPNSKMHTFVGALEWNGEKCPLDNDKMLLRGCRIRNTQICYGLVIYAGIQTKIMKNSGKVTRKNTKLDLLMNKIVFSIFMFVIIVALCCAVGAGFWQKTFQEKHDYIPKMPPQIPPALLGFFLFWGYVILLNILVPLMLYITMDVMYMVQSSFINWDLEMYHAETDTPAAARATTLNDHLGQIEYIFSDKTGTLTQNIMTFKKCCINGHIYGTSPSAGNNYQEVSFDWNPYADKMFRFHDQTLVDIIKSNEDHEVKDFFRLLALCHTVMVEDKDGELIYQASSPDEEALVTAARSFGYVFLARTQDTITICELGVARTYSVLAHMDFNSVRKRMSILVRDPDGKIMLYTKGADNVILQRLNPDSTINDATEKALNTFANETLRTLCIAFKQVEESEYIPWEKKHMEASLTLQNRAKELHDVYEEIETNLMLLGITAIEDKLQDGVSETIELLRKGNMKIWVLTGDKQETAVNIGFSCSLLSKDMKILDEKEVCDILEASLKRSSIGTNDVLESNPISKEQVHHGRTALVITGDFLSQILNTDDKKTKKASLPEKLVTRFCPKMLKRMDKEKNMTEKAFVDLASHCQTVICCRVTPKQKAIVVEMVKKHKKVTTLAIGDGGNDVNMIKTAHIGVGISGQEGLQAVIASDYALAQFRFLQRLLLVHGRWSYFRISKFLRYYFYKTFALLLASLWFGFFSGFSGQIAFDIWYLIFNGVVYTVFPALVMGMIDQDVSAKTSLQFPELYCVGQRDSLFNFRIFVLYVLYGILSSLVTFFIPVWAFWDMAGPDGICDYQAFSVTVGTGAVLAATIEVCLEYSQWNVFSVLTVLFSLGIFFLTSFLTQLQESNAVLFPLKEASRNAFSKLYIWAIILLSMTVSVLPSLVGRCIVRIAHPTITHRNKAQCGKLAEEDGTLELKSYSKENYWLRRASNAFSHDEGYADLIRRGASIRKKRAVHPPPPLQEERGPCQEENTTYGSM